MYFSQLPEPPEGEPRPPLPEENNRPPYLSGHRPKEYRFSPYL